MDDMLRVILILAVVMLTIYCVVDVAQSRRAPVRAMPHWMWAVAVIVAPVVGPISWLLYGRPKSSAPQPRHVTAPDDDEDFLRQLRGLN